MMGTPTIAGGVPWQSAIGAAPQPYGACSVPFVPCAPSRSRCATTAAADHVLALRRVSLPETDGRRRHPRAATVLARPSASDRLRQPTSTTSQACGSAAILAVSPHSSIAASYTFFESDTSSSLGPPTITGVTGEVGSLVQVPNIGILGADDGVTATQRL